MDIKGATPMAEEVPQAYFNQPLLKKLGWGSKLTQRQALTATKNTAKSIGFCAKKIQREKYLNEVSPFTETLAKTMDLGEVYSQYLEIVIKRLDDDKKPETKPETKTSGQDQPIDGDDKGGIPLLGEWNTLLQQTVDIIERELARKEAEKKTTLTDKAAEEEKAAIYELCREYNKGMDRFMVEIREKIQQSTQAEAKDKAEVSGGQDKAHDHSQESRATESAKKKNTGGSCCSMIVVTRIRREVNLEFSLPRTHTSRTSLCLQPFVARAVPRRQHAFEADIHSGTVFPTLKQVAGLEPNASSPSAGRRAHGHLMEEPNASPSNAIAGNLSQKHGLAPEDDQVPGDHHGPWQEDAAGSSKLVETQAATFNRNPRSPSPSPALDRPIYQWTENTLSLLAKPALLRSMSFPQKDEAILEAWLPKTDDFVALLQGPGTRLLNLVGPPFSGKSTAAPAILRRISANTPFVFIYVAKTQLDVETLSRECAPVWKRCGTSAIHVVTYEGLQEKLLLDGLPSFSVVFFDEDPEASVSYVMAWLSLCICAAKQTEETRLRIVAISEGEASSWQRASLTNLGKVSTEQMEFMKAPFRSMLDPEAYITNHSDAPTPIARRSFLNNFVDTSQPAEKRVLVFYGDHATLAWWLKGMTPKTGRPPVQVLRIRDTSSTTTINRFINRVARARPGDRLAVCIQPGVRISFEQASKFQFTHVLVYGRYTQGVVFSRVTGSFVNSQDASKPAYWEVLRTLTLGSSYEVLPATSVFCPSAPFARRDETQLYRQKDLPAFILSCVDLAERHSISFSHLMEAFSDDLEPDIGVEMLRRLGLAGLVDSPGPGEFHPSQSMRARVVCEWLPLTRNSAAAARLMAGLKLYENNIPLQRTIIAMAIVFAYSDTPFFKLKDECLLSPSDISSRLTAFFYKEGESAAIPLHHGYLWYALEIFRWAINIGDVGKLNKGGKLCLAQVLEVDEGILGRMYAHYLCIAAKVGHGTDSKDDALNLSPINSSDASSLHDELLYCSLDQLYWIDDMGNPEWPPPPKVRGPQATIMDLVSQREVKAGQDCRLLVLGELAGPRRGVYAVSISPIVCGVKSSFHVPNLTHIPPETMERWHTMRIEHDSHVVFHRGRSSKKIFPSRYPCVRK